MTMEAIKNSKYLKNDFTISKVTEFIKIIDFIGTAEIDKMQVHITKADGSYLDFTLKGFYDETPEDLSRDFLTRKVIAVDNLLDVTNNNSLRRVVLIHPDSSVLVIVEIKAIDKYQADLDQMRSIFKEGLESLNLVEEKVKSGLFLTGEEEKYLKRLLQFAISIKKKTTVADEPLIEPVHKQAN